MLYVNSNPTTYHIQLTFPKNIARIMDKMQIFTTQLYREVGQRIRLTRRLRKLNQTELALKVGLSRTSITNIERGEQRVLLHHLYAIADALSIPPADLLPNPDELLDEQGAADLPEELTAEEKGWVETVITDKERENES